MTHNPKIKIEFHKFKDLYGNMEKTHNNRVSEFTYEAKIYFYKKW